VDVSVKIVYAHRANVMRTLKLRSYSDLIQFAIRHKIAEIAESCGGADSVFTIES
jgi:DNA-binding NarL/FixJ family response regulator